MELVWFSQRLLSVPEPLSSRRFVERELIVHHWVVSTPLARGIRSPAAACHFRQRGVARFRNRPSLLDKIYHGDLDLTGLIGAFIVKIEPDLFFIDSPLQEESIKQAEHAITL